MKLSTQALATMSARHPWRTIGAWVAAAAVAVVAIGALLGGALTTEGNPNQQSAVRARRGCAVPGLADRRRRGH